MLTWFTWIMSLSGRTNFLRVAAALQNARSGGFVVVWVCCLWGNLSLMGSPAAGQEARSLGQELREALAGEDSVRAVKLLTELIAQEPENEAAWYRRGCEHFRLGKFKESVADFDRYVKLAPAAEQRLWERGISHYYAEMHREGAEQFALYQTYHDNDVENSVWRFLCMAKTDGLDKARQEMLPIKNDPRIPLMEAYALFQGKSTPEKVLEQAHAGNPTEDELAGRLFYARLYLGLYYEAHNQPEKAREYITAAWKEHDGSPRISRYMWHVARVHASLYAAQKQEDDSQK